MAAKRKAASSVVLTVNEVRRLALVLDDASRLHVVVMERICTAAGRGVAALNAAVTEAEALGREARAGERRAHLARRAAEPVTRGRAARVGA